MAGWAKYELESMWYILLGLIALSLISISELQVRIKELEEYFKNNIEK